MLYCAFVNIDGFMRTTLVGAYPTIEQCDDVVAEMLDLARERLGILRLGANSMIFTDVELGLTLE